MKRSLMAIILALCLFGVSLTGAEGLLPSLVDTIGKPMPSLGEALGRYPDEEISETDGGITEVFRGVTETEFNTFSVYLTEKGTTLADYQVVASSFSASIQVEGKTISFIYDTQTLEARVNYPKGTYDEWLNYAKKQYDSVDDYKIAQPFVAKSEVLLNGDRAPGNRTEETNLGDLITDAMVWCAVREGGLEHIVTSGIVGITNGGCIRKTIAPGDVTKEDIVTVLPFGLTVAVIYVTGEELLEALEVSTYATPEAIGGFPQTSGIVWTLDTTKAFDQGDLYILAGKETVYYAPKSIQRVTIESINGEPFDPAKTYAVVTNSFCAAGGDTYVVFDRAYNEDSSFDTGIPMDEALMEYITIVLNGKITEEAYGAPQGRLTIYR